MRVTAVGFRGTGAARLHRAVLHTPGNAKYDPSRIPARSGRRGAPPPRGRRAAGLAAAAAGLALAGLAGAAPPFAEPGDGGAGRTAGRVSRGGRGAPGARGRAGRRLGAGGRARSALGADGGRCVALALGGMLLAWGGGGLVARGAGRDAGAGVAGRDRARRRAPGGRMVPPVRAAPPIAQHAASARRAPRADGGALAAAIGPHVGLVVLGVILAAAAGHLLERAAGGPRLPLAPAATILLLAGLVAHGHDRGPRGPGLRDARGGPVQSGGGAAARDPPADRRLGGRRPLAAAPPVARRAGRAGRAPSCWRGSRSRRCPTVSSTGGRSRCRWWWRGSGTRL